MFPHWMVGPNISMEEVKEYASCFDESYYQHEEYRRWPFYLPPEIFDGWKWIMRMSSEIYEIYSVLNIRSALAKFDKSLNHWKIIEIGYDGFRDNNDPDWAREMKLRHLFWDEEKFKGIPNHASEVIEGIK